MTTRNSETGRVFELEEGTLRRLSRHFLSSKFEVDKQALALLTRMMLRRAESGNAPYKPEHPIVLYEGQVLDGRHRQLAAIAVLDAGHNVCPTATNFEGTEAQATTYVYEDNVARRMMSREKRFAKYIDIAKLYDESMTVEEGMELSGLSKTRVGEVLRDLKKLPRTVLDDVKAGKKKLETAAREQSEQSAMRLDFQLGELRSKKVWAGMHVTRVKNRVLYAQIMLEWGSDFAVRFDGHVRAGKSPSAARESVLGELDWGRLEKSLNLT